MVTYNLKVLRGVNRVEVMIIYRVTVKIIENPGDRFDHEASY